jgi:hypothetical protein
MYGIPFFRQAKNKIGQAKTSATEASKQVQKALEEVNKIVEELNDLADIGKLNAQLLTLFSLLVP